MRDPAQSVMYLAGRRHVEETVDRRISNSMDEPAHGLLSWEDVVLASASRIEKVFEKEVLMLVLPLAGELDYHDDQGHLFSITAGQVLLVPLPSGVKATVRNVYVDATVNCLIGAVVQTDAPALMTPELHPLPMEQWSDQLRSIWNLYLPLYIGQFSGRSEARLRMPGQKIFVFVVEGAFEVQHRLLEYRDGMVMWNTEELELEALSNNAIILMAGLGN